MQVQARGKVRKYISVQVLAQVRNCAGTCASAQVSKCWRKCLNKCLRKYLRKYTRECASTWLRTCALAQGRKYVSAQVFAQGLKCASTCANTCASNCASAYASTCAITLLRKYMSDSPWARYENPPPPPLGIFEDSDFWTPCYMNIQYLLVCTQNIGA